MQQKIKYPPLITTNESIHKDELNIFDQLIHQGFFVKLNLIILSRSSYMDSKSIQSRGIDFVKSFYESFYFDRTATSSRLGEVRLYRRISEPWEVVAVKSISIANSLNQQDLKNLQVFYSQNGQFIGTTYNEHPNLTQIYGLDVHHERQQADVYLEYCYTTIKEQINLRQQHSLHFSSQELWRTTLSIILAAEFLQSRGSFIGDVRTSRIFLNKKGLVKVVPFMQSTDDITSYQRVVLLGQRDCFVSPELLEQLKENQSAEIPSQSMIKSDVFGLGLALLEMATLRNSIEVLDWERYAIKQAVIDVRIELVIRQYGKFCGDVLKKMLNFTESKRVSFSELSSCLSPYAQAIITGVGFESIPELHSAADYQLRQINDLRHARQNDGTTTTTTYLNSSIDHNNTNNSIASNSFSMQNYDKNSNIHANSHIRSDVVSPPADHNYIGLQAEKQHLWYQTTSQDTQNIKPKLETIIQQVNHSSGISDKVTAQHNQTSNIPQFTSFTNYSLENAQPCVPNTYQPSYIKVENQDESNNNNIETTSNPNQECSHPYQYQLESIPEFEKIDNNNQTNNLKQQMTGNNPIFSNINVRQAQTAPQDILSHKSSNGDIYINQNQLIPPSSFSSKQQVNQIIPPETFDNDPIQLKKMDLQKANINGFKGIHNQSPQNINNSFNTAIQSHFELLNTSIDKSPQNLPSQESQFITSYLDRSVDNLRYANPQLSQLLNYPATNQKNTNQHNINSKIYEQNNPFFKPQNINIAQKQQIFNNMPIKNNYNSSSSSYNLNSNTFTGHNVLVRSSNNPKNNSFTTIEDLSLSLHQVPVSAQINPITQVVPSNNVSYCSSSTNDLRQLQIPVKKIILNTMLSPVSGNSNQLNTSLSSSSSARDLQRHLHQPLVQINLLGEQSQLSQRYVRAPSRSVSPQTLIVQQRQILPQISKSIIINNNTNPPAKIINLSSQQVSQPISNILYRPQSTSRQPSPLVRFQQLSTPSPKVVQTVNTFYSPQNANASAHQLFRREIPFERQPQLAQSQQNQITLRNRQNRHREVLFTEENK